MAKYKISFHVHTKYSHDSLLPFWLLYQKCLLKKINAIAITEHNNAEGALAFQDYCFRRGNQLYVIVGEEIMTTGGEIIGLYLKETIPPGLTPEETIAAIQAQNGVVYIPHPYEEKRRRSVLKESYIVENLHNIDCMECHNGRNTKKSHSQKQKKMTEDYGIMPIIGEDAHTIWEIGCNTILVDELPTNRANFLRIMPSAEFSCPRYTKVGHYITKIERILKFVIRGDFIGLSKFIYGRLVQSMQKMV